MFRSKANQQLVHAQLALASGERLEGNLVAGLTGNLVDHLGKPLLFVEFERNDGCYMLIAKASIASVTPIEVPRAESLTQRLPTADRFDPYAVLGLAPGARPGEISAAYRALARKYHPDIYAGLDAPPQVIDYVSAMFRRITLAYSEIKPQVREEAAQSASAA
jgi:hypothetical protein